MLRRRTVSSQVHRRMRAMVTPACAGVTRFHRSKDASQVGPDQQFGRQEGVGVLHGLRHLPHAVGHEPGLVHQGVVQIEEDGLWAHLRVAGAGGGGGI